MKNDFTAQILTLGNELLRGTVLNTNAAFLGRELTHEGFECVFQAACRDRVPEIRSALREAVSQSDLVVLSGGLGPTPDDVTRDAISEYFGVPLVFSEPQFRLIQKYYRRHGKRRVPDLVRREAMFPQNSTPLVNRHGIALGFYLVHHRCLIVVLPGVPSELEKMFAESVRPLLRRHFKKIAKRPYLAARTVGISEPDIMKKLGKDFFDEPFDFGIYPEAGEVSLRLYAEDPGILNRLKRKIQKRLKGWVYACEDILLAEVIGKLLLKKRASLAVAESCTGGLLAAEICRIPGASRYFKGSLVAYDNSVKEGFLKVSGTILNRYGAVSRETALAMAEGVRRGMKASYGLSVTGIAGPAGGSRKKPVGLVYFGLAAPQGKKAYERIFWGGRRQIQTKAVKKALEFLWRAVR